MIIALLGLIGLVFGSFVNAAVWRLHEQAVLKEGKKAKGKSQKLAAKDLSILHGRSMCPSCHHELGAKDLVPVFSWLYLRGKCRYCRKPISWQYPVVELVTAGLFMLSYISWPEVLHGVGLFQFAVWLVFVVAFMVLAVYDLRWYLLPDKIVYPLQALALVQVVVVAVWLRDTSLLWQPLLAAAIFFAFFWLLFQLSGGKWIGGGDVKLAVALGLLAATPLHVFLVIFFSSVIGTLVSIPLLSKGKSGLKAQIPYGPHLLAATIIVVLYGENVINWYQNLLV